MNGYNPVTYDNLSRGNRWSVKWGPLEVGDILYREKLVYASSCGVYGNTAAEKLSEQDASPNNPYGAAKLACEIFGQAYQRCYNMPFVGVRLFSLYGPRLRQTVIYDLLKRLKKNPKELKVYGTGKVIRDFTYVKDAAEDLISICENPKSNGEVYNYSGNQQYSILEVVEMLLEILGLKSKTLVVTTGKSWSGDMDRLCSDNTKVLSILPKHSITSRSLKDGLGEYIEWLDRKKNWGLMDLKYKI